MTSPPDMAIPVPVHFDGHNINIITEVNFPNAPTPASKVSQTAANKDRQSLYKTELCREWSTSGWCYYGKRCSFAHGLNELRPVFRSKKWRTKRCRNWEGTGYCPYEHRCQFLHDQSPPRRLADFEDVAGEENGQGTPETADSGTDAAGGDAGANQQQQDLYFHFKVHAGTPEEDDESVTCTEDSENAGAPTPSRPHRNQPKNILGEIGNVGGLGGNHLSMAGTRRRGEPETNYAVAGENVNRQNNRMRKVPEPVVTPFTPLRLGAMTPTAPGTLGQQTISLLQAQQIVGNQTAASQLAAQLTQLQLQNGNYFDHGLMPGAAGLLARGVPSVPMAADAGALLSAMYAMGPGLAEMYAAAQLGQLPQAELEHLLSMYPTTAPVPFTPTGAMTPGPIPATTPAPVNATLVLDGLAGTPSGSVEPPGFDNAFYPTPSPPPSAFNLDSVSNLGLRFIPHESPMPFVPYQGLGSQPGFDPTLGLDPVQLLQNLQSMQFSVPQVGTPGPMPMFNPGPMTPQTPQFDSVSGAYPSDPRYYSMGQPSSQQNPMLGTPFGVPGADFGNVVLFGQNFQSGVLPIDNPAVQPSN